MVVFRLFFLKSFVKFCNHRDYCINFAILCTIFKLLQSFANVALPVAITRNIFNVLQSYETTAPAAVLSRIKSTIPCYFTLALALLYQFRDYFTILQQLMQYFAILSKYCTLLLVYYFAIISASFVHFHNIPIIVVLFDYNSCTPW